MDNSFSHFGDRGFHGFQQEYRPDALNNNQLGVFSQQLQQQPNDQQSLSPDQSRSRGSSFAGSPTSPTSAHRPPVSQPSAPGLQRGYFPIGATGGPTSPVSQAYDLSRSHSINSQLNYGYEGGGFGGMPMPDESGIVRSRNNSEYMVNQMPSQMPTPRHSTSGPIGQQSLHYQQQTTLARYADSVYPAPTTIVTQSPLVVPQIPSPFLPAPPSPPNTAPAAKKSRRSHRSHVNDEPIGFVYVDKSKFKCNKSDCKDLTFGRMADLRRHYEQTHAKNRVQYFCRESGCPRSHAPTGGRGRSFGTRKDKRDEHERNVHKNERRESSYSSNDNV